MVGSITQEQTLGMEAATPTLFRTPRRAPQRCRAGFRLLRTAEAAVQPYLRGVARRHAQLTRVHSNKTISADMG